MSILPFCSANERLVFSPLAATSLAITSPPVSPAVISPFRRGEQTWVGPAGHPLHSPDRIVRLVAPPGRHSLSPDCCRLPAGMLGIISLILQGCTSLLVSQPAGSWSQASSTLVLPSMSPLYSVSDLCGFNNYLRPDCWVVLQQHGILRQNHPSHRGSGRMSTYNFTSRNSIPSLWSCRNRTSSLRHHNKQHVNLSNLRPLPQSSQPITKQRHLKLALLNTRSLNNNKSLILNEFITDTNLDFSASLKHGINPLTISPSTRPLSGPTPLVIAVIYCPPKPYPSFFSDFSDFLTQLCSISPTILLLGDFNIHIDNAECKSATEFLELLQCFNFIQHIDFPTHNRGHILDLVCSTGLTIPHLSSLNLNISDHLAITMDIDIPIPFPKAKRNISFRNLKTIYPATLTASLASTMSSSPSPLSDNPSVLVNYYNNTLSSCLDQLAPITTRIVSFKHSAPWYPSELHQMKSRKRQLERLCKKNRFNSPSTSPH